jgi:hypothetical protein
LRPFISFSISYPELNSAVLRHTDNERFVGNPEVTAHPVLRFEWPVIVRGQGEEMRDYRASARTSVISS